MYISINCSYYFSLKPIKKCDLVRSTCCTLDFKINSKKMKQNCYFKFCSLNTQSATTIEILLGTMFGLQKLHRTTLSLMGRTTKAIFSLLLYNNLNAIIIPLINAVKILLIKTHKYCYCC